MRPGIEEKEGRTGFRDLDDPGVGGQNLVTLNPVSDDAPERQVAITEALFLLRA